MAGFILLLPGLCTEIFFGFELHKPNAQIPPLIVTIFVVGLGGAALIVIGIVMGIKAFAGRD